MRTLTAERAKQPLLPRIASCEAMTPTSHVSEQELLRRLTALARVWHSSRGGAGECIQREHGQRLVLHRRTRAHPRTNSRVPEPSVEGRLRARQVGRKRLLVTRLL